jgi:hypothetical protein
MGCFVAGLLKRAKNIPPKIARDFFFQSENSLGLRQYPFAQGSLADGELSDRA